MLLRNFIFLFLSEEVCVAVRNRTLMKLTTSSQDALVRRNCVNMLMLENVLMKTEKANFFRLFSARFSSHKVFVCQHDNRIYLWIKRANLLHDHFEDADEEMLLEDFFFGDI